MFHKLKILFVSCSIAPEHDSFSFSASVLGLMTSALGRLLNETQWEPEELQLRVSAYLYYRTAGSTPHCWYYYRKFTYTVFVGKLLWWPKLWQLNLYCMVFYSVHNVISSGEERRRHVSFIDTWMLSARVLQLWDGENGVLHLVGVQAYISFLLARWACCIKYRQSFGIIHDEGKTRLWMSIASYQRAGVWELVFHSENHRSMTNLGGWFIEYGRYRQIQPNASCVADAEKSPAKYWRLMMSLKASSLRIVMEKENW